MDFFNIPSELSKANSPAYKSGLLRLYAKGGFTGRSDYKRSIENDIRVGMYEDGGGKQPLIKPSARLNFVNPSGGVGYQADLNRGPLSVGLRGYTDVMHPLETELSPSIGLHGRMGDINASYNFAQNQANFNARLGGDKFSLMGNAHLDQGNLAHAGLNSRYQVTPDLSFQGNLNWEPNAPHPLGYNLAVSYRKRFENGGEVEDPVKPKVTYVTDKNDEKLGNYNWHSKIYNTSPTLEERLANPKKRWDSDDYMKTDGEPDVLLSSYLKYTPELENDHNYKELKVCEECGWDEHSIKIWNNSFPGIKGFYTTPSGRTHYVFDTPTEIVEYREPEPPPRVDQIWGEQIYKPGTSPMKANTEYDYRYVANTDKGLLEFPNKQTYDKWKADNNIDITNVKVNYGRMPVFKDTPTVIQYKKGGLVAFNEGGEMDDDPTKPVSPFLPKPRVQPVSSELNQFLQTTNASLEKKQQAEREQKLAQQLAAEYARRSNTTESTRTTPQNFTPQQRATAIPRQSNVVGALDIASDIMRFGKYIPHPVAQAIGNAGTLLGNGIDMYQGINYLNQGNYKDAAANAIMSRVGKTTALGAGFELAYDISNYEKGGLIAFDEGGKSGDPTDEELAKKQIRYNQIISDEYKSLLGQQYINELNRVNSVIKNVIPTAKKIDSEDNKYYHDYPTEYEQFLRASNPKELELARQNLPPAIKSLLPNEGRYNIAQWDAKNNTWKSGADPSRELYCTPYGCFNYQKAGATDVPIIPGNVTFANKAEKGELPFEKINPKDRQPGDIALLVEMAPADYINNSNMVLRPHHTTIYSRPEENSSDPKKGYFYNAQGGNRLSYNESFFNLTDDSKSRIDYYRYVGKTKKIKEELDRLDTERLELKNYLDKVYENRKVPSKGISLLPQEEYSVPMSSKIPTTNFGTKLKVSSKKMSNVGFGELPNFDNYNLQTFEESPAILKKGGLQLFGKGGYRVVRTSERKGKTHKVIGPGGKVKYFGDPSMGERSKSKYGKEAFYKRHAKNLKANPYFRAYARATWSEGGIVRDVEPFNLSSY